MEASTNNIPCPVCQGGTTSYRALSAEFMNVALEQMVGRALPARLEVPSYEMRRCRSCTLEFAHPPKPATDAFYDWLDNRGDYYITERWEWDQVRDIIKQQQGSKAISALLEIGAGDGYFLNKLRAATGTRVVAIERSPQVVAALQKNGMEAYAQDARPPQLEGQVFDFVLSFHCLEHVVDPVNFLRDMCHWAGVGGRVLFSVPYSPMYFESLWFDPLNHPPHHMTRWNKRSLSKLAECVGGRASFMMPRPYSVFSRAKYSVAIHYLGPHWYRRRLARIIQFLHPFRYLTELYRQSRREKINDQPAADVVLVEIIRN